jgi:transcription factor SFP1
MSAAQPITFLSHENQNQATSSASQLNDIVMGSFNNSPFNPASYTRKFLESPQTWKAGSFGSRFYPGCSPGQLLGPLE